MSPKEVLALAQAKEVKLVNFRFHDLYGNTLEFDCPIQKLTERLFSEGIVPPAHLFQEYGLDDIARLRLLPASPSAFIDPFAESSTLILFCNLIHSESHDSHHLCVRHIAEASELKLREELDCSKIECGVTMSFYLFDRVHYQFNANTSYIHLKRLSSSEENRKPDVNSCSPTPDSDSPPPSFSSNQLTPNEETKDLIRELMLTLNETGIPVSQAYEHPTGSGHCVFTLENGNLSAMCDQIMKFKYITRNLVRLHGKSATFMPKPMAHANGSDMPVNCKMWRGNTPVFYGSSEDYFSELGKYFLGGALKHTEALCAFLAPTTNSYKRLHAVDAIPYKIAYSTREQTAISHPCSLEENPASKKVELHYGDPTMNPYLALSAFVLAGLDGVKNKIDPVLSTSQQDADIQSDTGVVSHLFGQEKTLPFHLLHSIRGLEADHEFLTEGRIIKIEAIRTYTDLKRSEYERLQSVPHLREYELYYQS